MKEKELVSVKAKNPGPGKGGTNLVCDLFQSRNHGNFWHVGLSRIANQSVENSICARESDVKQFSSIQSSGRELLQCSKRTRAKQCQSSKQALKETQPALKKKYQYDLTKNFCLLSYS